MNNAQNITGEAYYVCTYCAHYQLAFEKPLRCENCDHHHGWLEGYSWETDAADRSEDVLAMRAPNPYRVI